MLANQNSNPRIANQIKHSYHIRMDHTCTVGDEETVNDVVAVQLGSGARSIVAEKKKRAAINTIHRGFSLHTA